MRVVQRSKQLRFAMKARQALGVAGDFGQQHFDRHVAIELRVAGAEHLAHSAFAQLLQDLVRTELLPLHHVEPEIGFGETSP